MAEANDSDQLDERRSKDRCVGGRRIWDAHFGLERRHNELEKRVDTMVITMHQIGENISNNHLEAMRSITRVEGNNDKILRWLDNAKPGGLGSGQALAWFAVFLLLLLIVVGIYK